MLMIKQLSLLLRVGVWISLVWLRISEHGNEHSIP
jgi:hypothetical protein